MTTSPPSLMLVLILATLGSTLSAAGAAPGPPLRLLDHGLHAVVQAGRRQSPTFRTLVDGLNGGDVVVYVRFAPLPGGVEGRLVFLTRAAGVRYVLVDIEPYLGESRTLVILGHELQHALEVLGERPIVDRTSFAVAYERMAVARRRFADGRVTYDTAAARAAGHQVWRELTRPSLREISLETR